MFQANGKPAPGCVMSFAAESWLPVPMVFCATVHDGFLKATLGPLLRLHISNGHNVRLKAGAMAFIVKERWFSQRPNHPLTNRKKTRGQTELFSENFWKFLYTLRFVRPILLYDQNGPD